MALTPQIRATQERVNAVASKTNSEVRVTQGITYGVYNVPAEFIRSTQAFLRAPINRVAPSIRATQGVVMAVVSGRIDNPKLRAWTYTLDGHDFYVLKLGTQGKTLVFDMSTGQWAWWSSQSEPRWRASVGMNWKSSFDIPAKFGSNVVVGDDSSGIIWVLDPEKGLDDDLLDTGEITFPRVATGQMPAVSRQAAPIYSVSLSASYGKPSITLNSVKLEYSDDQGNTYVVADEPQVAINGAYDQEFIWRSLGQVRAPGRLFRITDNGAFSRVDSLTVNE